MIFAAPISGQRTPLCVSDARSLSVSPLIAAASSAYTWLTPLGFAYVRGRACPLPFDARPACDAPATVAAGTAIGASFRGRPTPRRNSGGGAGSFWYHASASIGGRLPFFHAVPASS